MKRVSRNVSIVTVSRVLNDSGPVSDATPARISMWVAGTLSPNGAPMLFFTPLGGLLHDTQ